MNRSAGTPLAAGVGRVGDDGGWGGLAAALTGESARELVDWSGPDGGSFGLRRLLSRAWSEAPGRIR